MPDEDSDNRLEIIIDEETRKAFEKIRYVFGLGDYKEVLEHGVSLILTYFRFAEKGFTVLVPAKKEGTKLALLVENGKIRYWSVTVKDIERLLYWKQMQDTYKGFKKDDGDKKAG